MLANLALSNKREIMTVSRGNPTCEHMDILVEIAVELSGGCFLRNASRICSRHLLNYFWDMQGDCQLQLGDAEGAVKEYRASIEHLESCPSKSAEVGACHLLILSCRDW